MGRSIIVIVLFSAFVPGVSAQTSVPNIPSSPNSEKECFDWGQTYQRHFDAVVDRSRASDERCRSTYRGQFRSVQSLCPNTTGGPVPHQSPCDEAGKWRQCQWLGFQRGMSSCLSRLSSSSTRRTAPPADEDYTLDEDDVAFLQKLASQDEFIRQLAASAIAAEILGRIIHAVVKGPVKLAVQWNLGLIEGWKRANVALGTINKRQTCDAITEQMLSTKALRYFDTLYKVRGC